MTSDPGFDAAVRALTDGDPPRVWSLLVTVFGDLGQSDDPRFSGALLRAITAPIGVRSEALRVALHRLRKEGWITSDRNGRGSDHRVTDWGRAEIARAAPIIYARAALARQAVLILSEPGEAEPEGVTLRPGVTLAAGDQASGGAFCVEVTDDLPDWMRAETLGAVTEALALSLGARLDAARAALPDLARLDPLQRATLRVLVVHGWRRIALRAPVLPDRCLPRGSVLPDTRAATMALLDALPVPEAASLTRSVEQL
jgi:phenylacetic acid degradation operon negative regulatory protein